MEDKEAYQLEEMEQEYNDIVGKKSANLGEALKVAGIQAPPGFAISAFFMGAAGAIMGNKMDIY